MKRDAIFEFVKGRQFLDAALGPAFGATSQALHAARLKDLIGPLNVKSVLTIGDSRYPMFPEAAVHVSALHWAYSLMPLNAKSALAVGGKRPRRFPKRQSTRQPFIGL